MFGDRTPVRDINHNKVKTYPTVKIADGSMADVNFADAKLYVISTEGDTLSATAANYAFVAIFTAPDSKAEKMANTSPYIFCLGNPIRYIDPSGEEPTEYEAAVMADLVYIKDLSDKDIPDNFGWKISSYNTSIQMNNKKNGLRSALFERTIDGVTEYAYVFAGTQTLEDWKQNVTQIYGKSSQYASAIENAKILSSELAGFELTFVGHSQGGGEAAASSMATGRKAITFNPAHVSPKTKKAHNLGSDKNIINYRIVPAGNAKYSIGGDGLNNFMENLGSKAPGKTIQIKIPIINPIKAHDIHNFVNYFE